MSDSVSPAAEIPPTGTAISDGRRLGTEAARDFCRIIAGEDQRLTFEGYFPKGHARQKDPARLTGQFDECIAMLETWAAEGRSVYVRVNAGGTRKNEITAIRAISIEFDAPEEHHSAHQNLPVAWHSEPSCLVRRGGSVHAHWVIKDCPIEQFEELQKRAQAYYQSDPSAIGLQRIWRVPGFRHPRFPDEEVELIVGLPESYTVESFERDLPVVPGDQKSTVGERKRANDTNPVDAAQLRQILSYIDPTFEGAYDLWVGITKAINWGQFSIVGEQPDWVQLMDDWCSGALWRERTEDTEFEVSTYPAGGTEDLIDELGSPRADGPMIGLGTLVQLAKHNGYVHTWSGAWMFENLPDEVLEACDRGLACPARAASVQVDLPWWIQTDPRDEVETDRPLLARDLMRGDFPRVNFVWGNHIVEGYPNLLGGDGGVGKTTLAIQCAAAVAAGKALFGLPVKQMPALLVLAEDDYGETKHRLHKACHALEIDSDDLAVHVWCRAGKDSTIAIIDEQGRIEPGPFGTRLLEQVYAIGPCLVVLDTVVDLALLDENLRIPVNTLAKRVLGLFCKLTRSTMLVTAHPSKASMQSGAFYAGSTAWNGAYRSRMVLKADENDADKRILNLAKANYSSSDDIELFMHDGMLVSWNSGSGSDLANRARDAVRDTVLRLLADDIQVVRGNGNGLKPHDLAAEIHRKTGLRLSIKRVRECLGQLEIQGVLRYQSANKNARDSRAGFVKGPLVDGPLGQSSHPGQQP